MKYLSEFFMPKNQIIDKIGSTSIFVNVEQSAIIRV